MNILALDTTGKDCAVALRRPHEDDVILRETIGRGHAERLAPMVQECLSLAGLGAAALDQIGVTIGPGSFAGTRVGVAFARGLALAAAAPAYGISNLAVWAAMTTIRPVVIAHDAKRGDVIVQTWTHMGFDDPERLSLIAAQAKFGDRPVSGPGASLFDPQALPDPALDLSVLLDLTARAPDTASPPAPFYARPPDAKLPGGIDP